VGGTTSCRRINERWPAILWGIFMRQTGVNHRAEAASRRAFLRTSAAGTTAALGALPLMAQAHAVGDGTIRIGMIGCGERCSGAAFQAMQAGKEVRLVAMCDIFADKLQAARSYLQAQLPEQVAVADDDAVVGFDGYRHVIEQSDAVLIACASKFHPMYAEAAIAAGKHVFVEKPHGIDPAGVARIRRASELAKAKGLSLVSGLQSRYHRGWQEVVKRIHDGAIGEVVSVQSMFLRGPYRVNPREKGLTETEYQFRNWYHFRWLSGDDVTQSLVHNVDRVSWILKEEMPAWAFGLGGRSASFGEEYGDMFDHHTVVYEYDSGPRVYALCRTQLGCYGNSSDVVMGTKGRCYLGESRIVAGGTTWKYSGPPSDPYGEEQRAFIGSIRSGTPVNSGSYMANSTLIGVLGQLACYTGKPTTWEDVSASELEFGPSPEESNFGTAPPSRPDASGNYPLPMPGVTKLG
jgi:predicted dehydrogenase